MRAVSKIHSHSMERFSHWETGLGKYTVSWGAYINKLDCPPDVKIVTTNFCKKK